MNNLKQFQSMRAAGAVFILAAGVGGAALAMPVAAVARDARTSFTVSATVNAVARLELQSAPATIQVSAADVRRGFVDVADPTRLVIRSNSPSGFALDVSTLTPMLAGVIVRGLESDQVLGAEGGTLVQRWNRGQVMNLSLKFRLVLAPGLRAGDYPWPMHFDVRPLVDAAPAAEPSVQ